MLVKKIQQIQHFANSEYTEPREVITYFFLGIPVRKDIVWLCREKELLLKKSDKITSKQVR